MLIGKVIVITGVSDGLGKELAKRCCALGSIVIGIGKMQSKLDALHGEIIPNLHLFQCDLSKKDELEKVYDMILNNFDRIDILINNAAIWYEGAVDDHDLSIIEQLLMTNVFSVMGSTYKILPGMKACLSGTILMINSIAGVEVSKDWTIYSATKHAITAYTQGLQQECRDYGIKVMQIHPGGMNTNIFESFRAGYGKHNWMMDKNSIVDLVITMLSQPQDVLIDTMVVRKF